MTITLTAPLHVKKKRTVEATSKILSQSQSDLIAKLVGLEIYNSEKVALASVPKLSDQFLMNIQDFRQLPKFGRANADS